MKLILIFALIFTFAVGTVSTFAAQNPEKQAVKINKQKKFSRSKLNVKFVSLVEDSRCPEGVNCVWAGNAKIKIEVSSGKKKETFEVNTNIGPKGAAFDGYAINLVELTPTPKANAKINRNSYTATFEITRLTR